MDIKLEPISVEQYRITWTQGSIPPAMGDLLFTQQGPFITTPAEFVQTASLADNPVVYQSSLNAVTEVTIQTIPSLSPFYVLVFSREANPDFKTDHLILVGQPYDFEPWTNVNVWLNTGKKFNFGPMMHGPYKLPGNFKYFRVFRLSPNVAATQNNLLSLGNDPATAPNNPNRNNSFVIVNVYGY